MTAQSANVFESFASLVQFYPKLSASIALGVMAVAANSMKAFVSGNNSVELIETTPLPSLPIPARVRSHREPQKKRPAARKSKKPARKSTTRPTRRRKAA
jgi:hypothetical protein